MINIELRRGAHVNNRVCPLGVPAVDDFYRGGHGLVTRDYQMTQDTRELNAFRIIRFDAEGRQGSVSSHRKTRETFTPRRRNRRVSIRLFFTRLLGSIPFLFRFLLVGN